MGPLRLIVCKPIVTWTGSLRSMNVTRRVGANLRRAREEPGISQEELADRAGLHRTYVSGVERGVRNPTVIVLEKIAKALKVKSSSLLE